MKACLIEPFSTIKEEIKESKLDISKRLTKSTRNFSDKASVASIDPWHDNYFGDFTNEQKMEIFQSYDFTLDDLVNNEKVDSSKHDLQ